LKINLEKSFRLHTFVTSIKTIMKNKQHKTETSFSSVKEKQEKFHKELKDLLLKFKAEINLENFGSAWADNEKIVIDFAFDEELFEKTNTGIIPQIILGRFEDGK
jgi:hypothetical protein